MKVTLDIDDVLLAEIEALAAQRHISLGHLIEEGLQLRLRAERSMQMNSKRPAPDIPIYSGTGGLNLRVDPTSNKALFAATHSR